MLLRHIYSYLGPLLLVVAPTSAESHSHQDRLRHSDNHRQHKQLSCSAAQQKCVLRNRCGWALNRYMIACADIITGKTKFCNDLCKKSLIAITSTEEGQQLMKVRLIHNICSYMSVAYP